MRLKAIQAHLVFVSLLIATQCALAQTNDLQFNHLLGSNGITLGKINAITQDKLGFIWLSDQSNRCLVRYDGNHMKRFSYSQGKPNTLGGYYPECLATDPSGILWIGFYGQGLDRYDPYTNTFTHYSHSDDDPESLSNNVVSAVLVDHLGNVWIGTDGGLDLFDAATGKFKHFKHDPADSTSLSHDVVRSIYEDRQGVLWVGTGIAFVPGDEGGLNRFDRTIGTFTRYIHEPENPNSLVDNKVRAIFEDSYGNFWVGTRGDGIHKMNREAGTFQRFRFNPADPNALSRLPSIGGADHITFIIEDTDRKVWFGSLFNGVTRYDPSSGALERFGAETPEFSDNTSWCAYAAPDGHVWLSTQNSNLFRIDLHNTVIPYYAGPGYVRAYLQESSSVAWFGTDNGLIREDRNEGQRQVFRHDPNNPTSISSNDINAIIKDSNGEFWIGTTNGLNRFDPSTKLFTRYYHDPNDTLSLGDNNIQKIAEDGNGYLWIGTNTSGFYVFDRKAGKVHKAFPGYYGVWALAKIGDQYLWGGTPQMGFRYDVKNEEFNYFFDGIGIQCYYPDAKGLVWIGTEQGLYCYNHKKDVFDYSQFTRIDIEGSVSSIIGDNRGNLWMTSPNIGLIRYTPETRERIVYGKRNNVQLESLATSTIYQAEDGNLLIGTRIINGYHKFNPDKIRENQDSSRLYFSSLSLNGIDFTVGDGSVFTGSIFTASNIRLAHNQNTFALRFTEIDFTNDDDTRIYYRLENYDTEWRNSYAEEPANYFQIPPGEYVFKIRANHNQSGQWTEKSLAITIAPPWWTTWWAYSGYGLLFMGGVFLVDRVQ
nr:hypothetical protein [Cyclobacteriaceae bacterium]